MISIQLGMPWEQAVAEDERRTPRLFLGQHMLDLRQDLGLPWRRIGRLLSVLVLHIGDPNAAEEIGQSGHRCPFFFTGGRCACLLCGRSIG